MEKFDFTLTGLKKLLNTEGINSKGILKKAFDNARIVDLQKLKKSIDEEINNKVRKIVGRTRGHMIKYFYIDESIEPKE